MVLKAINDNRVFYLQNIYFKQHSQVLLSFYEDFSSDINPRSLEQTVPYQKSRDVIATTLTTL